MSISFPGSNENSRYWGCLYLYFHPGTEKSLGNLALTYTKGSHIHRELIIHPTHVLIKVQYEGSTDALVRTHVREDLKWYGQLSPVIAIVIQDKWVNPDVTPNSRRVYFWIRNFPKTDVLKVAMKQDFAKDEVSLWISPMDVASRL